MLAPSGSAASPHRIKTALEIDRGLPIEQRIVAVGDLCKLHDAALLTSTSIPPNGRSAASKHHAHRGGSTDIGLGPDLLLCSRQDVEFRFKAWRHQMLSAEPCSGSPHPWQTTIARARIPRSGR